MALRDKILSAQEMPTEQVQTDEWAPSGVPFVHVRGLTAAEREDWETWVGEAQNGDHTYIREKLVALAVVEEIDGKMQPVFSRRDVEALSKTSSAAIVRIWNTARHLSGMQTEAEVAAEANPSRGDQAVTDSPDSP